MGSASCHDLNVARFEELIWAQIFQSQSFHKCMTLWICKRYIKSNVYIYIRICINYVNFVNLPSEILRQTKTSGHLECRVKFLHPLAEGCPESLRGPWRRSQWNVLKPYGHYGFPWNLSKWISVNCIYQIKMYCLNSLWFHDCIHDYDFTIHNHTSNNVDDSTHLPSKERTIGSLVILGGSQEVA